MNTPTPTPETFSICSAHQTEDPNCPRCNVRMPSPTPETDAIERKVFAIIKGLSDVEDIPAILHAISLEMDAARKLERERDEARQAFDKQRALYEATHAINVQLRKERDKAWKLVDSATKVVNERDTMADLYATERKARESWQAIVVAAKDERDQLRKLADEFAASVQFIKKYQTENCDGQIRWRAKNMSDAIAGDVRVHHVLKVEAVLAAYKDYKKGQTK